MRGRWVACGALGAAALGAGVLLAGPPVWILDRVAARYPGCLFRFSTEEPVVALTIDDGPDATTTPVILRELRRYGARATFFVIGERVRGREGLTRRLVAEGHELGNHFMRDRPAIGLKADEFVRDLEETHHLLAPYGPVHWARPGSGWYSRTMVAAMTRNGYRCALGSVYPWDAAIPSAGFAEWHILRNVRPGAILVLHDGGPRGWRTAQVLRTVLPALRRRGYRVVALSELAPSPSALARPGTAPHRGGAGGGPRPTSTALPQRGLW